jgi:Uma2 family endonuclease
MSTAVGAPSAHELWVMGKVPYSRQSPGFTLTDFTRLRRFTVDEYHTMIKAGVFGDYEPGELLEGVILWKFRPMTPRECFPQHAFMKLQLNTPDWHVSINPAVTLADSEPEPDAAIVRGNFEDYDKRFPVAGEVGVAIEFADASLEFDRVVKQRIYARAGIPEYWIVNVVDTRLEVYTDPDTTADPPAYRTQTNYAPGQAVPLVLDGQAVAAVPVADLLP